MLGWRVRIGSKGYLGRASWQYRRHEIVAEAKPHSCPLDTRG